MVYDRIHGHHDPTLVILSIVIAIFASYTALDLAGRIRTADGLAASGRCTSLPCSPTASACR
jgi:NO-binding membrane sensor protein with MHYT domain